MWAGAFGGPSPIAPGVLEFILVLMEARRPEAVVGGVAVSIKVIITEVIIIHVSSSLRMWHKQALCSGFQ